MEPIAQETGPTGWSTILPAGHMTGDPRVPIFACVTIESQPVAFRPLQINNYGNVSDDFISSMLTVLTGTAFLAVPFISNIIYIDVKLFWYEMLNTMSFYIMSIIIVNCIPNLYYILLEMEMNID